jgi:purine-binding chemotaxis protein CheW
MANGNHPVISAPGVLVPLENEGGQQYLLFTLNGETFAIDILCIREIIDYAQPTEVPLMPPSVRGVINLRGAVVPVIDLSARFGRRPARVGRRTCTVILELAGDGEETGPQTVGVVVDGVNEVLDIPAADIEPAPSFGVHLRTDFIAGMGRVNGRFIVILNLPRVLALDELGQFTGLSACTQAA